MYRYRRNAENPVAEALARMRDRLGWYDPEVLGALESLATLPDGYDPRLVPVEELAPGHAPRSGCGRHTRRTGPGPGT